MKIFTDLNHLANHTKYLAFLDLIRSFLLSSDFIEVRVPSLSPVIIPESHLGIFQSEFQFFGEKESLFLTPHPELFLKRLLASGSPSLFTITKAFRNQESTTHKHSPEFDMLEFYKVNANYSDLSTIVLLLLQYLAEQWFGNHTLTYQGKVIDLSRWEIFTVEKAFEKFAKIVHSNNETNFLKQAKNLGYKVAGFSYTEVWSQVYSGLVEPNLGTRGVPTLIKDYPQSLGATAQYNTTSKFVERFEFYIEGIELGNGATENAQYQSEKELEVYYHQENLNRNKNCLAPILPDIEFPSILKRLPPTAGIGIGLERLAAIFINISDIRELKVSWVE